MKMKNSLPILTLIILISIFPLVIASNGLNQEEINKINKDPKKNLNENNVVAYANTENGVDTIVEKRPDLIYKLDSNQIKKANSENLEKNVKEEHAKKYIDKRIKESGGSFKPDPNNKNEWILWKKAHSNLEIEDTIRTITGDTDKESVKLGDGSIEMPDGSKVNFGKNKVDITPTDEGLKVISYSEDNKKSWEIELIKGSVEVGKNGDFYFNSGSSFSFGESTVKEIVGKTIFSYEDIDMEYYRYDFNNYIAVVDKSLKIMSLSSTGTSEFPYKGDDPEEFEKHKNKVVLETGDGTFENIYLYTGQVDSGMIGSVKLVLNKKDGSKAEILSGKSHPVFMPSVPKLDTRIEGYFMTLFKGPNYAWVLDKGRVGLIDRKEIVTSFESVKEWEEGEESQFIGFAEDKVRYSWLGFHYHHDLPEIEGVTDKEYGYVISNLQPVIQSKIQEFDRSDYPEIGQHFLSGKVYYGREIKPDSSLLSTTEGICYHSSYAWNKVLEKEYSPILVIGHIEELIVPQQHFFNIIRTKDEPIILDGTYRQFFRGYENKEYEKRFNELPGVYMGNLDGLINLFKKNKDLLHREHKNAILSGTKTKEVSDEQIESFVRRLYSDNFVYGIKKVQAQSTQ